jgi:hypothetical protein
MAKAAYSIEFGFRISDFGFSAPPGSRGGCPTNTACGGGAIFNIVGHTDNHIGVTFRANNVEGGSSRERRSETSRVPQDCFLCGAVVTAAGSLERN